jgi:hypothetical protein
MTPVSRLFIVRLLGQLDQVEKIQDRLGKIPYATLSASTARRSRSVEFGRVLNLNSCLILSLAKPVLQGKDQRMQWACT